MANDTKADYYVSPTGNDSWSGTLPDANGAGTDGPFLSLSRARDAVREIKGEKRNISVLIREGTYLLRETVVFGSEDAASAGTSVTYAAYPGERPVFSSGVKITGWRDLGREWPEGLSERARPKVWVADVPDGLERFCTLFEGDHRLVRAQTDGFAPLEPSLGREQLAGRTLDPLYSVAFPPGAIKFWPNLSDVELIIRANVAFTMQILPLRSVDEVNGIARTALPSAYPLRALDRHIKPGGKTAWIENVLEGLTSPGEWAVNMIAGKIYYWPTGDEPGDEIYAPCLREFIRVEGEIDFDGPEDRPTRGIVFKGLTFTHGDRGVTTKKDASIQHDWEMIDKGDALLRFRGAEDCGVEGCRFFNSGATAIRLDLHCQNNRVLGNEINHLGGAGIVLIGYGPGTKDVNKNNELINNHIHHCGEIWWHAHGIVVWQSGHNRIAHNSIHHMPRKGICISGVRPSFFDADQSKFRVRECAKSIRWFEIKDRDEVIECGRSTPWDRVDVTEWKPLMRYLHTRNNVIEFNEVYRVAEVLGDGAAINITATGDDNVIRRNYVHDINNPNIHGSIRTDDYQRTTLIEENVIWSTRSRGFCLRHENYVINNVVVDVMPGSYVWIGQRDVTGMRFEKNILFHPRGKQEFYELSRYGPGEDIYEHIGAMRSGNVNGNIYFKVDDPEGYPATVNKLRSVGYEKNGAYVDPMFEDWENGDFRLKPGSPALKMGIKSIDVREAGLTDDFPW